MGRAVALTLALLLSACSHPTLQVPPATGPLPQQDHLEVGLAQVDITPPIGLGMFGHAPESRVSTGIALRLRCQILVATGAGDKHGEALAFTVCDLPAPSLYLQRAIATYLAKLKEPVPIDASRIALLATHTHFGPNHYFAVDGYTGPFSGRRTGLDEDVVSWLAERIGDGIAGAFRDRDEARVAWAQTTVPELSMNRSVTALLQNQELPADLAAAIHAEKVHPEQAAVDRTLSLLRVETRKDASQPFTPAGGMAFFGIHPTVINARNSLYTGDLFGYATRRAEARIEAQVRERGQLAEGRKLVVGIANGIEGDVTAVRGSDTHREAARLGHRLGDAIAALWQTLDAEGTTFAEGPLRVAYRELHWSGAKLASGQALCRVPGQGTAAAAGGNDHPTGVRIFGAAAPGVRSSQPEADEPCGWPRYPLIGLDPEADPGEAYPDVAPVAIAQLGAGVIVTVPAEVTTVTGLRARDEVRRHLPDATWPVVVAGLANEYLGYIATFDEYQVQHYEGASTLYGPHSAEYLREQLGCLGAELYRGRSEAPHCGQNPDPDKLVKVPYHATRTDVMESKPRPAAAPSQLSRVRTRVGYEAERVYEVDFVGPEPDSVRRWKDLEVYVKRMADANVEASGEGERLRVLFDDRGVDRPWTLQWLAPTDRAALVCGQRLYFEITTPSGTEKSETFPARCDVPQASEVWP